MKSVAIIAEYNPFHNGHQYQATTAKSLAHADVTIAIMSGQFVMRGEPAIYNKFHRTLMALSEVDLVAEMPIHATLSGGEYFANTGVQIARYLDVNSLSFGAESDDITQFTTLAEQLNTSNYREQLISKVKEGKSYARGLAEIFPNEPLLSSPNNTLGLSYVRAILQQNAGIEPLPIRRLGNAHHDTQIHEKQFASGTAIRQALQDQNAEWRKVVPYRIQDLYTEPSFNLDDIFPYLKYVIIARDKNDLKHIYGMTEGIESRLKTYIGQAHSYEEFIQLIKTKRYTRTHLQRLLMNVLLNIKTCDVTHDDVTGVRILGMTEHGRRYLKHLQTLYPERNFVTNVTKKSAPLFKNEIKATTIFNFFSGNDQTDFNTPVIRR
ncbi:nucleotidyltransferase [Staphylococcus sp. SQ8-PEA]|uniref:tRNA(Met) cytidine acetate ligase n=1 Tax=Staphylococcus marylandisciuri TaxID=2981529 RepID=A0ABT2QNY9_9STAP|nr:nucleotidyltransferase [Staphylococcus marylandisciuri]MCU5745693.1 nucleotidyltransferase [Staphylococcus marylandisciuri]